MAVGERLRNCVVIVDFVDDKRIGNCCLVTGFRINLDSSNKKNQSHHSKWDETIEDGVGNWRALIKGKSKSN